MARRHESQNSRTCATYGGVNDHDRIEGVGKVMYNLSTQREIKTYWITARSSDCDLAKWREDSDMGEECHLSCTVEFHLGWLGHQSG